MFTVLVTFTDTSCESYQCRSISNAKEGVVILALENSILTLSLVNIRSVQDFSTYGTERWAG